MKSDVFNVELDYIQDERLKEILNMCINLSFYKSIIFSFKLIHMLHHI